MSPLKLNKDPWFVICIIKSPPESRSEHHLLVSQIILKRQSRDELTFNVKLSNSETLLSEPCARLREEII